MQHELIKLKDGRYQYRGHIITVKTKHYIGRVARPLVECPEFYAAISGMDATSREDSAEQALSAAIRDINLAMA